MQSRKRCDFCSNDVLWKNCTDVKPCYNCKKIYRCCNKCKNKERLDLLIEELTIEHDLNCHTSVDLV